MENEENKLEKIDVLMNVIDEIVFNRGDELKEELRSLVMKILTNTQREEMMDKCNWDLEEEKIDARLPSKIDWCETIEFRRTVFDVHLEITKGGTVEEG